MNQEFTITLAETAEATTTAIIAAHTDGYGWALMHTPRKLTRKKALAALDAFMNSANPPSFGGPFHTLTECIENAIAALDASADLRARHVLEGVDYASTLRAFASANG